ncbi:MAG: hypothetical protein AAF394_18180, partial [Planctomycetota bacterium]
MSQFEVLQRLVDRIVAGEVVFFVGSGFSVDSEGNTATRLMLRLLVRFSAMQELIAEESPQEIGPLAQSLYKTFEINTGEGDRDYHDEAWRLSIHYYEANEWFCATFFFLLLELAKLCGIPLNSKAEPEEFQSCVERLREWIIEISERENEILAGILRNKDDPFSPRVDAVSLDPIDPRLVFWACEAAGNLQLEQGQHPGKALFLDTMGFANPEIMRDGWSRRRDYAQANYEERLYPRHHVLARFAREGLCPLVMTTNYDLLL